MRAQGLVRNLIAGLFLSSALTACAPAFEVAQRTVANAPNSSAGTPTPTTPVTPVPVTPEFKIPAIQWESKSGARSWSVHAFNVITEKAPDLLSGSTDVAEFCPKYASLGQPMRAVFWTELIAAVAYYESAWKPTSRMQETTMGTDPVTQQPVYSEGLLQLSYQDKLAYPFCDEFDWGTDRWMSATDPKKSILDPMKNLSCGIQILNRQVRRTGKIALSSGVYWAVLKVGGKYTKLPEIKTRLSTLTFCK